MIVEALMRTSHKENTLLSDEQIGTWVREWRSDHGLSQHDLAELLHCDQPTVCRLERGRRKLTAAEYIALVEARPQTRGRSHDDSQPTQGTASNDALGDADELVRILSERTPA